MQPPAQPLSPTPCHVDTQLCTQVTVSAMGIASDRHSKGAEVRHPAQRDTGTHIDKCARPDMDTWNVKACLLGRAGCPARLREPGCPPSERCKASCVPRRRLEEGTTIYACHAPARTRRASTTRSTGTCSTGKPTSAAIASKGVRCGRGEDPLTGSLQCRSVAARRTRNCSAARRSSRTISIGMPNSAAFASEGVL